MTIKYDFGKIRPSLLPAKALIELTRVLEYGASKYAPDNWRTVKNADSRYLDAALRHLLKHMAGVELDEESGFKNLHLACINLLFLVEFSMEKESAESQMSGL